MDEVVGETQKQRWGVFAGILVVLFLLLWLRKRRKMRKLLIMRAQARARSEKTQRQALRAKTRARAKALTKAKPGKKGKKKGKKKKSLPQKLARFATFQILKKIISNQIKQMEDDLGQEKLGKKLVDAMERPVPPETVQP